MQRLDARQTKGTSWTQTLACCFMCGAAVQNDVPGHLNDILDTLPTRVSIKGLPFYTAFQVTLFTSTYVMVQGACKLNACIAHPGAALVSCGCMEWSKEQSETVLCTLQRTRDGERAPLHTSKISNGAVVQRSNFGSHDSHNYVMHPFAGYGEVESDSNPPTPQQLAASNSQHSAQLANQATAHLRDLQRCPFEASPLPIPTDAIAADSHMLSLYLHQSIINCMAWGLYRGGMLQYSLVEGSIPSLHLTTDLLAMLIPQLPKQYPHQHLRIDIAALSAPRVTFSAAPEGVGSTVLEAAYRTVLYVANDTLGNPQIASLAANLSITAQVGLSTLNMGAWVRACCACMGVCVRVCAFCMGCYGVHI